MRIPGVGSVTAESIKTGKAFLSAERELKKAAKEGVQLLFFTDSNYPSRLRQINDAPALIYVKGNVDFENPKSVAIVGTRKATAYGLKCVEELMDGLIAHQALIMSGLAYGIDVHAHKVALQHGLPTVGVMGSGIDVIYPAAHKDIARKMMENGAIVTEHKFGTKPDAHNFPARNRIVAALSDAVVIVEAAEKGGALITAEIANSYNKDVFAFPGHVGASHSAGCNNLIKANKANLISGTADLEYIMNWNRGIQPKRRAPLNIERFSNEERLVVQALMDHNRQLVIDELSWKTNLPVSKLASVLLNLEFQNVVKSLPGKIYKLMID